MTVIIICFTQLPRSLADKSLLSFFLWIWLKKRSSRSASHIAASSSMSDKPRTPKRQRAIGEVAAADVDTHNSSEMSNSTPPNPESGHPRSEPRIVKIAKELWHDFVFGGVIIARIVLVSNVDRACSSTISSSSSLHPTLCHHKLF